MPVRRLSVAVALGLVLGAVLCAVGCAAGAPADTAADGEPGDRTIHDPYAAGRWAPVDERRAAVDARGDGLLTPVPTGRAYADLRRHTAPLVGEDRMPDVSLDGDTIVFASTRHATQPDIYAADTAGGPPRRLTTHPANDIQPRLSPARADQVAFASDRSGDWNIYIMSLRGGGAVRQVTRDAADELNPCFSPDGMRLAYSRRNAWGIWEIAVRDLRTGAMSVLGPGIHPEWSPLEDVIAFQRPRETAGGLYSIWTVRTDGSDLTEVAAFRDRACVTPGWSVDGERLVFATSRPLSGGAEPGPASTAEDIWTIRADGSALVNLTWSEGPDWSPVWRAGRVWFVSRRGEHPAVWSLRPTILDPEPEPRDPAPRRTAPPPASGDGDGDDLLDPVRSGGSR